MSNRVALERLEKLGPLPLVVGITGHRDLCDEDVGPLEDQVRSLLQETQRCYPHTPLLLLSSLAEGAERLAARVGLAMGLRLMVPLPMRRDVYQAGFSSPSSRQEFQDLLCRAERWFELLPAPGNEAHDLASAGEAREHQCASAGAYIALHSQILIALWDGVDVSKSNTPGGTAQVVRFRLNGVPAPYAPTRGLLEDAEKGPLIHIITPRRSNPRPCDVPFTRRVLYPYGVALGQRRPADVHAPAHTNTSPRESAASARIYNRTNERMQKFNRDAVEQQQSLHRAFAKSAASLLPVSLQPFGQRVVSSQATASGASDELAANVDELSPPARSTLSHYAVADALSVHFAGLMSRTLKRGFISVFVAALCFNLFHSLPPFYAVHDVTFSAQQNTAPTANAAARQRRAAQCRERLDGDSQGIL